MADEFFGPLFDDIDGPYGLRHGYHCEIQGRKNGTVTLAEKFSVREWKIASDMTHSLT